MTNYNDAFHDAYLQFYEYLGISSYPISFTQWNQLPQADKGIALYVNFYSIIRRAWSTWYNKRPGIRTMEDGLSYILDRFSRVVSKAIVSANMYTEAYIRTCCNRTFGTLIRALRCRSLEFNTYEVGSNIVYDGDGKELNLYDLVLNPSNCITFDSQYTQYKLAQLYTESTDEVREIIDIALTRTKLPQRILKKSALPIKQITEHIFENNAV